MALAIIGGSGLYDLPGLEGKKEQNVETPFGSAQVLSGKLGGLDVLFISRHSKGHKLLPGEINFRANICALKMLGARFVLSVSAAGSLAEDVCPGDLVLPNQFIDFTKNRPRTFFGEGVCAHVPFASPVCKTLHEICSGVFAENNLHRQGCYVCIEGPTFSTRAESAMYRQLGGTLIGMTNLPEARLAREAELGYVTLAIITDYDSWRGEHEDVDVSEILKVLKSRVELVKGKLPELCSQLKGVEPCDEVSNALKHGIMTAGIPDEVKERLKPIIGKYF